MRDALQCLASETPSARQKKNRYVGGSARRSSRVAEGARAALVWVVELVVEGWSRRCRFAKVARVTGRWGLQVVSFGLLAWPAGGGGLPGVRI